MADENLIENLEKLEQETAQLAENFRRSGDAAGQSTDATKKQTWAQKQATKSANELKAGVKGAADGLAGFAGDLLKNSDKVSGSFDQLNPLIDGAGKAIGGLAGAVPLIGGALKGISEALTEGAKIVVQRLESVSNSFRELGRVGGLTAQGMDKVVDQFNRSGLSLESYSKEIAKNSQTLASFGGMVSEGAEKFTDITGTLVKTDKELRRLGKSPDDIAEATANYIKQELRLRSLQGKSVAELTSGTKEYALQLDRISKLTGLSADAIAEQRAQAEAEEQYRAYLLRVEREQGPEAAQRVREAIDLVSSGNKELAGALRDTAGGTVATQRAQQGVLAAGNGIVGVLDKVASGQITGAELFNNLQGNVRQSVERFGPLAERAGAASEVIGNFSGLVDFVNKQLDATGKILVEQNKQRQAGGLTDNVISAQMALEGLARTINNEILNKDLLAKAASAVNTVTTEITKAIHAAVDYLNGDEKQRKEMINQFSNSIREGAEKGMKEAMGWFAEAVGIKGTKGRTAAEEVGAKTSAAVSEAALTGTIGAIIGGIIGGLTLGPAGIIPGIQLGGVAGAGAGGYVGWNNPDVRYGMMSPEEINAQYADKNIKKRDVGGPVLRGETAVVGERGPELVGGPASVLSRVDTKKLIQGLDAFRELRGIRFNDNGFQAGVALSEKLEKITNERLNAANLPALAKSLGLKNLSIENNPAGQKMNRDVIMDAIKQELNTRPDYAEFGKQLKDATDSMGYARGGIADTPSIFGEAGPEAAVPLPDGKTIPVTIDNLFGDFDMKQSADESKELMKTQIEKMDQLIRATEKNMMSDGMMMQVKQLQEVVDKLTKGNEISQNLLRAVRF